jgi:surface protein
MSRPWFGRRLSVAHSKYYLRTQFMRKYRLQNNHVQTSRRQCINIQSTIRSMPRSLQKRMGGQLVDGMFPIFKISVSCFMQRHRSTSTLVHGMYPVPHAYSLFFCQARACNQDISSWNVSNVNMMMKCMFNGETNFNHDISSWNTSSVQTTTCMLF